MRKNDDFTYELLEHVGRLESTITESKGGHTWQKEVNIVSWNGNPAKIDIRDWNEDHTRMSKGIALTEEEAKEVMEILERYFGKM